MEPTEQARGCPACKEDHGGFVPLRRPKLRGSARGFYDFRICDCCDARYDDDGDMIIGPVRHKLD